MKVGVDARPGRYWLSLADPGRLGNEVRRVLDWRSSLPFAADECLWGLEDSGTEQRPEAAAGEKQGPAPVV